MAVTTPPRSPTPPALQRDRGYLSAPSAGLSPLTERIIEQLFHVKLDGGKLIGADALELSVSKSAVCWSGRGQCRLALGQVEDALGDFDRALAIDPRYCYARFGKAQAEEQLGRKAEAARSYQQFLGVVPPHLSSLIERARQRIGALRRS